MRILGVCGSLQAQSSNRTLLERAAALAPDGVEVVLFEGLRELPPFDPELEASTGPIAAVAAWRKALAESDAVLVACPEYGFSLPGALKNAVDWVIGTGELERKVVGTTAAAAHADRGKRGLAALGGTLVAVSARIVGGRPIARGATFDDDVAALVRAIADEVTRGAAEPAHGLGFPRPQTLVSAWVDAFNRADVDALASFYAEDATNHQVAEAPLHGRDAIKKMFSDGFASATMTCIVENLFEDGEWAILEWRDPKGLRGCGFFQVKKGLIVFQRGYWDKLTFLRQQGLPLPKE